MSDLTDRHMPELVEEMFAQRPLMYQAHVARAYGRAGLAAGQPAERERFCEKATDTYRRVLALQRDAGWFRGESRRFDVAAWHIEFADLVLRFGAAGDLDRFEITSAMDFNRARLTERLREAHASYQQARALLDDLLISMRTEEERFLLMGLTQRVTRLVEQREFSGAWASLYLGMVEEASATDRSRLLAGALAGFDEVARLAKDASTKYGALIGAGMALRESGHPEEASAAFDRVIASTAGAALIARARYEKTRGLLKSGQFDAARREADVLAAMAKGHDAGAAFYVRMGPLLSAYSFVLQSRARPEDSPEAQRLANSAIAAFDELSQKGGPWPEIAEVYLRGMPTGSQDPASMTEAELRGAARRAMSEEKYAEAIKPLQILTGRSTLKKENSEDRFNLAVCYFQTQRLRPAAEEFAALADVKPADDLAERAAEYAYRGYRQLAANTKGKADYARLASAAELLATRYSHHALAEEAAWACGLARQESGDVSAAIDAYERIAASSPHYWPARTNAARCRQSLYESLPKTASSSERRTAAGKAVNAWMSLISDISQAGADGSLGAQRDEMLNEAHIAAAALLIGDDQREFQRGLDLLSQRSVDGRALQLQIAAYRGLGDLESARKAMNELLKQSAEDGAGPALLGLAADMEARVTRLLQLGRGAEAKAAALETLPTLKQLLDWLRQRPERRAQVCPVQLSVINLMRQAGLFNDGQRELDRCMADEPSNGHYIRAAALLNEDIARTSTGAEKATALTHAENLWSRLLQDTQLRENAPTEYWQARYYWLSHQLRLGRAAEVVKGIESERAWFPELGGPPWQGRLLELVEQARAIVGEPKP